MNALIQQIANNGTSLDIYGTICTAGTVISACYSLYHGWKIGLKKWRVFVVLPVIVWFMAWFQSFIFPFLRVIQENQFLGIQTATNSIVRVFVFIPLVCFVLAKVLRTRWSLVCDGVALYPLLRSGISQLACIFPGCCRGYSCSWGIYNIKVQENCFPTQILETVLTLGIFFFLVIRTKRKHYVSDGKLFPLMMVLYGAMRFVCELLRNNEKIFLGISAVGLHAAFLCVVGLAALLITKGKRSIEANKEPMANENKK